MSSNILTRIATEVTTGVSTERERAVAIHDFVRDKVRFGFTRRFDLATPAETLDMGFGHCNPQAQLFVELVRAAGIEARLHLVTIDQEVLHGCFPPGKGPPTLLNHAFSEVRIDGQWVRTDSYIVDRALAASAKERLQAEGRELGYGVHLRGTSEWDGKSDAFSQLARWDMVIEDHGTFASMAEFVRTPGYRHRVGPVTLNALLRWLPRRITQPKIDGTNARLDTLRASMDTATTAHARAAVS